MSRLNPAPEPKIDELLYSDILTISNTARRKYVRADVLHDLLVFIMLIVICAAIAMADIFVLLKLVLEVAIMWLAFRTLAPVTIVVNKASESIAIKRMLLDRWMLTQRIVPLEGFYAVRVRSIDSGRTNLLVELVGTYGAALTLLHFDDLDKACDFRDMVAEWLGINVLLDPIKPDLS